MNWQPANTAPRDGSHILVGRGPVFQDPPNVVHYWDVPGERGFYLSSGYSDEPVEFTYWCPIEDPPR